MPWYRRLRWRLVGAPLLVVVVGAASMLVATALTIRRVAPGAIRPILDALAAGEISRSAAELALTAAFGRSVFNAVLVAAVVALTAGVLFSLTLWRTIIRPLRQIADASRRIADGRYDERVPIADNGGEALLQLVTSFNQMAATLQEVEQQRVAMIGNVAHELRTPLTGLRGYIEGLADGLFPAAPETFAVMEDEIGRLTRLVDDIQALSRVEAGALHLDFEPFALEEVVGRVAGSLLPQAQALGLTLSVEPPPPLPPVYADRDRAAQVVANLLGNALRYTPAGGQIVVRCGRQARPSAVWVEVADTGIGIAADDLPYIFERFYRVDRSRSRESGGSGIGLTIARHLAWAMGGELRAASPGLGQGSTFTFALPIAGASTTAPPPAALPSTAPPPEPG